MSTYSKLKFFKWLNINILKSTIAFLVFHCFMSCCRYWMELMNSPLLFAHPFWIVPITNSLNRLFIILLPWIIFHLIVNQMIFDHYFCCCYPFNAIIPHFEFLCSRIVYFFFFIYNYHLICLLKIPNSCYIMWNEIPLIPQSVPLPLLNGIPCWALFQEHVNKHLYTAPSSYI